jgi:hypothetical protein
MSADTKDTALRDHQAWLGYLQPDGLVVSPAALVDMQVVIDRGRFVDLQNRLQPFLAEVPLANETTAQAITDIPAFLADFLEWPADLVHGFDPERPLPEHLTVPLRDFGETLSPTFALRDPRAVDPAPPWLILGQIHPPGTSLDERPADSGPTWNASPAQKFERLLRETRVPIGLLLNGTHIRLVYAPRGENTGSLTFRIGDMTSVAGRPILAALHLLLESYRLIAAATAERLPALLQRSRDYQSHISDQLAAQVLEALYELLRGFQAANERSKGELLRDILRDKPDDVYNALLTVLLRLVFVLFAEDRGLMPGSALFLRNYSIHGLFERLRSDAEQNPDTMDSRFGAWSQLLALFRAIHGGCTHKEMRLAPKGGHLFDPQRFPFLEGQTASSSSIPLVSDGTLYRVLSKLLLLGGERLSYRTLDVEHIGGVYQQMMDFRLLVTTGPSIAIKPKKSSGAPAIINLETLLATKPADRAKWLKEQTDTKLSGEPEKALKSATTLDDLLAALEKRMDRRSTPHLVPAGAIVLQPSDERRKSGSHYTPRQLTEPIVRKTLEPILRRLVNQTPETAPGTSSDIRHSALAALVPTPQQILDLKICDLAVGSAAFLVETCRQLADVLVASWHAHKALPFIPADEDEVLHARRLIAQRCLYGVDRNPMAVDLGKLSLWLATLARDHPFTFLDHSIRCGDALVGLTRKQIEHFHWLPDDELTKSKTPSLGTHEVAKLLKRVIALRKEILDGGDMLLPTFKALKLDQADSALQPVRLAGDLAIAAFFAEEKPKARLQKREELLDHYRTGFPLVPMLDKRDPDALKKQMAAAETCRAAQANLRDIRHSSFVIRPFHWHIEFPEVFDRDRPGFDAIVGNPPFAGKNTLLSGNREGYLPWLQTLHPKSHGNADLVAHFFRRAFDLVRQEGTFGLIATNTIGQGDTRSTGLRWLCTHGGNIYAASKRTKWPGEATVIVSVVWTIKGDWSGIRELDGRTVPVITAYLFHAGGHENPATLNANARKSFIGCYLLGMGFTFDDTDSSGVASSLAEMQRLVENDPRNSERIFPYIGGEELNESPDHRHIRYAINFFDFPLKREDLGKLWQSASEPQRNEWSRKGIVPVDYPGPVVADWPQLHSILEARVRPERTKTNANGEFKLRDPLPIRWWQYAEKRPGLHSAIEQMERVLVLSRVRATGYCFLPSRMVFSEQLVVFPLNTMSGFTLLQCRTHDFWSYFFSGSALDLIRYSPSDCFETYPFPPDWESNAALEEAGRSYYEYRAALMVRNNEGLTKTYNRFHDPEETSPDIAQLRHLHAAMDAAVITAYGWHDLLPQLRCEFLLDYEDEEDPDTAESPTKRRRKKPWRHRWPDDLRDEVLARLLKLNAERAEQERLAGKAPKKASGNTSSKKSGSAKQRKVDSANPDLFDQVSS